MACPSKEGVTVTLEVSLLYHLISSESAKIYKSVEGDYKDVILLPQFRSVVREITTQYEAKALYTEAREVVGEKITQRLRTLVEERGIYIESTPLRSVTLPGRLATSIEEKLKAEQEAQRMQFVLQKEKQEAERKEIEARGIQKFQDIVKAGINENLLKWKGIEATELLAKSSNAKVIVIGSGKNGLPLILGGQ